MTLDMHQLVAHTDMSSTTIRKYLKKNPPEWLVFKGDFERIDWTGVTIEQFDLWWWPTRNIKAAAMLKILMLTAGTRLCLTNRDDRWAWRLLNAQGQEVGDETFSDKEVLELWGDRAIVKCGRPMKWTADNYVAGPAARKLLGWRE